MSVLWDLDEQRRSHTHASFFGSCGTDATCVESESVEVLAYSERERC